MFIASNLVAATFRFRAALDALGLPKQQNLPNSRIFASDFGLPKISGRNRRLPVGKRQPIQFTNARRRR